MGLAADVIERFLVGTGARVTRAVSREGDRKAGSEEAKGGRVGIEVRGRMGRGGLKGSFCFSLVGVWVCVWWAKRERWGGESGG